MPPSSIAAQAPPRDALQPTRGTGIIRGRITDQDTGRPLHRAIVTLATVERGVDETTTDAEGRYEFGEVPADEYAVMAGPPELRATHLELRLMKLEVER